MIIAEKQRLAREGEAAAREEARRERQDRERAQLVRFERKRECPAIAASHFRAMQLWQDTRHRVLYTQKPRRG